MRTLADIIKQARGIDLFLAGDSNRVTKLDSVADLQTVIQTLRVASYNREADSLGEVYRLCKTAADYGGLELRLNSLLNEQQQEQIFLLCEAWLETLNSEERALNRQHTCLLRPASRKPMTLTEKILAFHDVKQKGYVYPGEMIHVSVDWIMSSETSWVGMRETYNKLGEPGIFRNDRFWLAGDHIVDPRVNHLPQIKEFIDASEEASHDFKLTEYQGMNYTIMHTEFYRERAQPGMLIIGADSHTCSSGAVGSLSIGLGGAEVTMALVTGENWFKVPESVNIRLVGKPNPGIGGKDVILHILKELKCNTIAIGRVIEFTGPGLMHLSCDARFAICNMTAELGGVTGICVPDKITFDFINRRKMPRYKRSSVYFQPDEGAEYAETREIRLSDVESCIARFPSPDNVVPIAEVEGMALDGCFIGACTTAKEDLVIGALVLEQGLKSGKKPILGGRRKVVPGSRPIFDELRRAGLVEIYEAAGFDIGVPSCSYCTGVSIDRAEEGEVWLSSQNRNFKNRMGKGSFGNLASAATVAASSFDMKISNPKQYVDQIDFAKLENLLSHEFVERDQHPALIYVEPAAAEEQENSSVFNSESIPSSAKPNMENGQVIQGKVQRLGDHIDTDALAPSQFILEAVTDEELGSHCLQFTHPEFRSRVKQGLDIVVAGKAFGTGSSREQAVSALKGCGVKCVIAESFSFIYSRNQACLGLVGIQVTAPEFYQAARDGVEILIDLNLCKILVAQQEFKFEFSEMERALMGIGGISEAWTKFGKNLFRQMCTLRPEKVKVFSSSSASKPGQIEAESERESALVW